MNRSASAVWQGSLKDGKGTMSTGSGTLSESAYSFVTRFEQGQGTNPEELIAAAHAGCFSMALSAELGKAGTPPDRVSTKATVTLEQIDGKWTISKSHLDVTARVPGVDDATFQSVANGAKANCPVSRALNLAISMNATLEG
jgi:osmotically inducible protein OsmC